MNLPPSAATAQDMNSLGLGLDHGVVELVESDGRWGAAYDLLASALKPGLGAVAVEIEHVGSTAVPGLAAKPILDVAVGLMPGIDIKEVTTLLEQMGFEYRGDNGDQGGRLFVLNARPRHRVAHVHVVEHGDVRWHRYIAFRDRLRQDVEARASYEAAKRHLARQFPGDRASYTAGKASVVEDILS